MRRVSFLVDGLNLYFSLVEMQGLTKKPSKWLDLRKMCEGFLAAIAERLGTRVDLAQIHYFAAYAPHAAERQRTYVSAIESTGVSVTISPFKTRDVRCSRCKAVFKRPEEKETDVAIAAKLLEVLMTGEASIAVMITGDTDFRPAITTARRLFPESSIGVITPFLRHTTEMQEIGDFHFKVSQRLVHASQFPNPLRLPDGRVLTKPQGW